jgi:hypothetical protein
MMLIMVRRMNASLLAGRTSYDIDQHEQQEYTPADSAPTSKVWRVQIRSIAYPSDLRCSS